MHSAERDGCRTDEAGRGHAWRARWRHQRFALGSVYWETGVFQEGAELLLKFRCETVGGHRLEARAAVVSGGGNGALWKMGAVQEGPLRRSFQKNGAYLDQALWTILAADWKAKAVWTSKEGMIIH